MPKHLFPELFIGNKYNKLIIISIERRQSKLFVVAQCECGIIKEYLLSKLINNHTRSCGCLHKELLRKRMKSHGLSGTRLHGIWSGMIDRCRRVGNSKYKYYGGRGISVCEQWQISFISFTNWAFANGYNDTLTIERKEVNGNYEPDNCKWIPAGEQALNTRNTHYIEFNGQKLTVSQWAKQLNINYNTLLNRINTYKWSIEKSLTTPLRS